MRIRAKAESTTEALRHRGRRGKRQRPLRICADQPRIGLPAEKESPHGCGLPHCQSRAISGRRSSRVCSRLSGRRPRVMNLPCLVLPYQLGAFRVIGAAIGVDPDHAFLRRHGGHGFGLGGLAAGAGNLFCGVHSCVGGFLGAVNGRIGGLLCSVGGSGSGFLGAVNRGVGRLLSCVNRRVGSFLGHPSGRVSRWRAFFGAVNSSVGRLLRSVSRRVAAFLVVSAVAVAAFFVPSTVALVAFLVVSTVALEAFLVASTVASVALAALLLVSCAVALDGAKRERQWR